MIRRTAFLLLFVCVKAFATDAAQLQLAIKKLTVVGSALYVAAHPDDDNAALIAYLANERLLRTAYLSMTRGDGGQNLIGGEKGDLLGVLRTQELLNSRRVDGGEQFFTASSGTFVVFSPMSSSTASRPPAKAVTGITPRPRFSLWRPSRRPAIHRSSPSNCAT
jgi:hypothetical protein